MHHFGAILLLGAALAAQQARVYVDSALGSDANPGTAAQPVKTIGRGLALAAAGATVTVLPGIYGPAASGETLPIQLGVTLPHQNVLLRGLDGVVFDCGGATQTVLQVGLSAAGARITNLRFVNSDQLGWWTHVIENNGPVQDVEIDRCVFAGVNRGVVVWDGTPHVNGWKIHNCLFVDLGNDAINVFEKDGFNLVFNNTVVGRTSGPNYVGILIESPNDLVANNLVVGMRDGFLCGTNAAPAAFLHNDGWNNRSFFSGSIVTPPPTNTSLDPSFVNAGGGDFRLQATSPLIDAGFASVPARADLAANPGTIDGDRNGSLLPDVGCFELPVITLVTTYDRPTGATSVSLSGAGGLVGTVFFALEDGLLTLPGIGPLLLDFGTLFPVVLPLAPVPLRVTGTIGPQAPGTSLVLQGLALETASGRIYPSNSSRLQW